MAKVVENQTVETTTTQIAEFAAAKNSLQKAKDLQAALEALPESDIEEQRVTTTAYNFEKIGEKIRCIFQGWTKIPMPDEKTGELVPKDAIVFTIIGNGNENYYHHMGKMTTDFVRGLGENVAPFAFSLTLEAEEKKGGGRVFKRYAIALIGAKK